MDSRKVMWSCELMSPGEMTPLGQVTWVAVADEYKLPRDGKLVVDYSGYDDKFEGRFGHLVMAGMGGIFIEVFRDVATALVPVSEKEAGSMTRPPFIFA